MTLFFPHPSFVTLINSFADSPVCTRLKKGLQALLILSLASLPHTIWAQGAPYPSRAIRMITPFATGGASDIVARIVAEKMSGQLGQTVVVDNRPGAGGAIAMESVAKAEPDGYTIGFASSSALVVVPATKPALTYPAMLAPLSHICNVPIILVARASLGIKTVAELVTMAQNKPGKITFGSSGVGGLPHVMGENFNNIAKVQLFHIPYKGDAQEIAAFLSGDLDVAFLATPSVTQLIESGKLKGLAIAGTSRAPDLPEVPTFAEIGYPESSVDTFFGLVISSKASSSVVEKLAAAAIAAVANQDVQEKMKRLSVISIGTGPTAFAKVIEQNVQAWSKVIRAMDLKELSQ